MLCKRCELLIVGMQSMKRTNAIEEAKLTQLSYHPTVFRNGDTAKQLLARSRYLLFKSRRNGLINKKLEQKFFLNNIRIYSRHILLLIHWEWYMLKNTVKDAARLSLARWYNKVGESGFKSFKHNRCNNLWTLWEILNFFVNRSTNASAESFNAKIKAFRARSEV